MAAASQNSSRRWSSIGFTGADDRHSSLLREGGDGGGSAQGSSLAGRGGSSRGGTSAGGGGRDSVGGMSGGAQGHLAGGTTGAAVGEAGSVRLLLAAAAGCQRCLLVGDCLSVEQQPLKQVSTSYLTEQQHHDLI